MISDFEKIKKIDVPSVTGTPTISKAQCLKIEGGDDSTTGTGNIVLDWTNISSKADIGVYDENDNLLDYYFESFDDTEETAVIWVYRDWVRDGSTQAQIGYGNGPSDQSVVASTVFDKETNLVAGYLFNESSGDLLDVTSNNNDGTLNGGVTQGATGIVDGAYDFDPTNNEYIDVDDSILTDLDGATSLTIELWFNPNEGIDAEEIWWASRSGEFDNWIQLNGFDDKAIRFGLRNNNLDRNFIDTSANIYNTGEYNHLIYAWDGSTMYIFLNDLQVASGSFSGTLGDTLNNMLIGTNADDNTRAYDGILDNYRIYKGFLNSDERSAKYAATKSSPDFFSQQAGESVGVKLNTFFSVPF